MKIILIVPSDDVLPSEEQMTRLRSFAEVETIFHTGKLSELEGLKSDHSEKILGVDPDSFDWELDAASVAHIPNVRAVCTSSTGFDWLNPSELKKHGVLAINAPGFSTDSVAEYAVCMAIEVARKLPLIIKDGWKLGSISEPFLLKGKRAGVVGLGRIGTRMAEILQGIGMDVVYSSRTATDDRFNKVELDELFRTSDVIMPALAVNDVTRALITREHLDMIKPTSVLVGIGGMKKIWDDPYIVEKIGKGELAGYAFEGEGAEPIEHYEGNILPLPAMAWATGDSLRTLMEIWVANLEAVAKGEPRNVVNA